MEYQKLMIYFLLNLLMVSAFVGLLQNKQLPAAPVQLVFPGLSLVGP